jgi:hypothetical protein
MLAVWSKYAHTLEIPIFIFTFFIKKFYFNRHIIDVTIHCLYFGDKHMTSADINFEFARSRIHLEQKVVYQVAHFNIYSQNKTTEQK